ncbi:MAG: hypothetical protein Q8N36_06725, partial [bacterium]|nr:hypothetical protein [bacterium]
VVLSRFTRGDFDLLLIGWALGLDPDPYAMFHSSQAAKNAAGEIVGFNRPQYKSAAADKLIEAGRLTVDVNERRKIYQELDILLNQDLPYIWVFQRSVVVAMANRIQGVFWSPTGNIWSETMFIKP